MNGSRRFAYTPLLVGYGNGFAHTFNICQSMKNARGFCTKCFSDAKIENGGIRMRA
jgi:hypothetical protein